MTFERVHAIWDYYDGIRSGVADHNGAPHLFECTGDWTNDPGPFRLSPVSNEFMSHALQNWRIFRAWEKQHAEGVVSEKTHPGNGGFDVEYDKSEAWLKVHVTQLTALPVLFSAEFRALPNQPDRRPGMLAELEVEWTQVSA